MGIKNLGEIGINELVLLIQKYQLCMQSSITT